MTVCKLDMIFFWKAVTSKIIIFRSKGKDLVEYFLRFLLPELTCRLQSFTLALDFLPKSCHCSCPRWKAVGDASHHWTAFRLAKHGQPLATPLRHPRCTADISWRTRHCNGCIWAKSLRLMWNFDGFVQNEYYVLRFSIWIQVILWHCRFLFFARQLQFPPSRRIYQRAPQEVGSAWELRLENK